VERRRQRQMCIRDRFNFYPLVLLQWGRISCINGFGLIQHDQVYFYLEKNGIPAI
jgi:hypothetical protein